MTDSYKIALENLQKLKAFKTTSTLITLDPVTGELVFDDNVSLNFESITTKTLKKNQQKIIDESQVDQPLVINLRFEYHKKEQYKLKKSKQFELQNLQKLCVSKFIENPSTKIQTQLLNEEKNSLHEDGAVEVQKARLEDKKMIDFVIMQSNNSCTDTGFLCEFGKP